MKSDYVNYFALGLVTVIMFGGVFMISKLDPSVGSAIQPLQEASIDLCGNGICDAKENYINCLIDCPTYCYDSDHGKDIYTFGYVNASLGFFEDHCLDDVDLVEYYCENDELATYPINCKFGCIDGVCVLNQSNTT